MLIESFRPGTLERCLGYDRVSAIRPELILVRLSGFGGRPTAAGIRQAGGRDERFAHITGEADRPRTLPQFPLADSVRRCMPRWA